MVNADLGDKRWNHSMVVTTDHHFLKAVLCNAGVRARGLFPPDYLEAQRALEAYLLRPSARVMKAVDAALARSKGCGVGVHLRKKGPDWRAGDVWPRLRAGVHRRVQAAERVLAPPRRLRVDAHGPQHAEGSSGEAPGREMN